MISQAAAAKMIQDHNTANQVVIYSKTYCPYCRATKSLLKKNQIEAKVIELDQEPQGAAIQQALLAMTGQRTVPHVFVNHKHVGGNDSVQEAFRDGTFHCMLQQEPSQVQE